MKKISTLGPSLLLALLTGISYFLITDLDTQDFTKNFSSLNMPYEMTKSFNKRTRFSDQNVNYNRPPFIRVKAAPEKDKNVMQLSMAVNGAPIKEKNVPLSLVMDLSPYVHAGNDPVSSYENYTSVPRTPPVINSQNPVAPDCKYSYCYGYSLEKKLDEINDEYDKMLDNLSSQYEASLDNISNNSAEYSKLKSQYKSQLNTLKIQHKNAINQYKQITNQNNKIIKDAQQKDIKGCTFTVEVVKTKTANNSRIINNPNKTVNRSKAVLQESGDSDEADDSAE